MLNVAIRELKLLAVLSTLLLLYLVYLIITDHYAWRELWLNLLVLQLAVLLYRRAARLLEQERRFGAMLGLICVGLGPKPTLLVDLDRTADWIWVTMLAVPLIVVWFQLGKRPASVVARVPEAP